jgi:dolichol-phosphate mannosyltransferase
MRPKISIIIPTKNEEEAIAKVLCSIPKKVMAEAEVIVVDSSTDTTPIIAERLGAKVIRERRAGKGRAMRTGAANAKGDILVFLDGDGTNPPTYIPKLVKELKRANLVLGSSGIKKFKEDDPWWMEIARAVNRFWQSIFRPAGIKLKNPVTGFRAIRKSDWNALKLKSDGFEIEAEFNIKAIRAGFKIREIAIPNLRRLGGITKSKLLVNPSEWFKIITPVIAYLEEKHLMKYRGKSKEYVRKIKKTLSKETIGSI